MSDLTHDGITQPISEWALDYGIPSALIRQRLNNGWSVERAITQPMQVKRGMRLGRADFLDQAPRSHGRAKRYTYQGEALTVREQADRLGVSEQAIRARFRRGWSIDRALTAAPTKGPVPKLIAFDGKALTVKQWADRLGIASDTLRGRLDNPAWTLDRALTRGNRSGWRKKAVNDDRRLEATA